MNNNELDKRLKRIETLLFRMYFIIVVSLGFFFAITLLSR